MTAATKPKLNTRLLRRVIKHFQEEPLRLDMGNFVSVGDEIVTIFQPPCGTTQCIAGAALILEGAKPQAISRLSFSTIASRAAAVLGLDYQRPRRYQQWDTDCEASKLFQVDLWPERFRKQYLDIKYCMRNVTTRLEAKKIRAKLTEITVNRIEHFIKHRE